MSTHKKLICIACPLGCRLEVEQNDSGEISVTGNRCNRGEEYGREELLAPKRIVTATIHIDSATVNRLPVKTDASLPKEYISDVLNQLYRMRFTPPVACGQVIWENIHNTGINVVATRTVE